MPIGRFALAAALSFALSSSVLASGFNANICAAADASSPRLVAASRAERVWNVRFDADAPAAEPPAGSLLATTVAVAGDAQGTPRARAVEYSHGYEVRMKIHKIASFATLPLFVTEYALGQKLYDGTTNGSVKSAHGAVAAGIAGLFGVNTVTGVWNLWEARQDPAHRGRRMTHAIMMLGADAGFVATGLLAPSTEHLDNYLDRRSAHRTVAITSMAVATASYLMMLFWK